MPTPRIALLPLDDRPVNVLLPQDVARVAGVALDLPPRELLPEYRTAGDADALGRWLRERAADPDTVQLVVSIDMLLYGGLIASRISGDDVRTVLARLDVLRTIRAEHPNIAISAVSLVMRASDSNSAAEEPEYWARHGRELHKLGGDLHRRILDTDVPALEELTAVPAELVSDFASRRIRNHVVNLSTLLLVEDGTVDFLAITADDTASHSAGSAEQDWLRHWMRFLPTGRGVLMYPGADEVGAVLVARALGELSGSTVTFRTRCEDPEGLERVPPFENRPLRESIERQVRAAGGELTEADADVVLVVHAPDPHRHNMVEGTPPHEDAAAAAATRAAIVDELAAGHRVALADVRYANGADALLLRELVEAGVLDRLEAFGAWNTAGNTLGSVVAVAIAARVGRSQSTFDATAARKALLTRLLDDYGYQTLVRTDDGPALFPDRLPLKDDSEVSHAEDVIRDRLNVVLGTQLPRDGWELESVTLPWRRSFEVELGLVFRGN